jgi:hypothetical protein
MRQGHPGHWFQTNHIGPYVVITCSCGWNVRKHREVSQAASAAARNHAAATRPPRDKYEALYGNYAGPSDAARHAGYKQVQLKFGCTTDDALLHGGNLRQRTPRNEKHHRHVVAGVRVT